MQKLLLPLIAFALLIPAAAPALPGDDGPEAAILQWQQLFLPVSPSPRASHAMAYDTARGVAVLLGGANSGGNLLGDTWEWNSSTMTWIERQPAHRPPALGQPWPTMPLGA